MRSTADRDCVGDSVVLRYTVVEVRVVGSTHVPAQITKDLDPRIFPGERGVLFSVQ